MTLLDLQGLPTGPSGYGGGNHSDLSLLLCEHHSNLSLTLCL
jgi:hypothetical protein